MTSLEQKVAEGFCQELRGRSFKDLQDNSPITAEKELARAKAAIDIVLKELLGDTMKKEVARAISYHKRQNLEDVEERVEKTWAGYCGISGAALRAVANKIREG